MTLPDRSRTNLLYLMSDQHAARVLGRAGDEAARTPYLDSLADRGVRLTNLYCPSPICVPSRMSILTARRPHEIDVWTNDHPLSGAHATWPHALGAAGYRPRLAGRLHSIGVDQRLGFAERLVGDHGPNHPGGRLSDFGVLGGTAAPDVVSLRRSGPGLSPYELYDRDVTAAAVASLTEYGERRRRGDMTPFALSVGFMLPHQPYVAQADDYALFEGAVGPPRMPDPPDDEHPYHRSWRRETGIVSVSHEDAQRARTAYYALVRRLDAMIGEILDTLSIQGLQSDTLVVYTSDHGDHLGERGLWWKQTFFDESAKVPGIVALPRVLPTGAICDRVVDAVDLTATVLDVLGADPLPNATGRSVLPLLRGDDDDWTDRAYSEYCTNAGHVQRMLRWGPWKLCYYDGQPLQLFNLEEDPDETHDLATSPEHAAVRSALLARLLDGWEPQAIRSRLEALRLDATMIAAWARRVSPDDQHRWRMIADMIRLDALSAEVPD